jgi:hypothetical protein
MSAPVPDVLLVVFIAAFFIAVAHTLFLRGRVYARWAKIAYLVAAFSWLTWGILAYLVMHPRYIPRDTYIVLLSIRHVFAGFTIGVAAAVAIARPYSKASRRLEAT